MPQDEPPDDDNRNFANIVVAIAVIVLVALAWFLIQKYEANQQMENCRIEGRRDCDPIPIPNQ